MKTMTVHVVMVRKMGSNTPEADSAWSTADAAERRAVAVRAGTNAYGVSRGNITGAYVTPAKLDELELLQPSVSL